MRLAIGGTRGARDPAGADRKPAAGGDRIDRGGRRGARRQPVDSTVDEHRRSIGSISICRRTGASSVSRRSSACVTALIFGLAPAIRLSARAIVTPRRARQRRQRGRRRGRRALVGAQVAITLVLLFGGLLFLRTLPQPLDAGSRHRRARRRDRQRVLPGRVAAARETSRCVSRSRCAACARCPAWCSVAETYTTPLGGSFSDTGYRGRPQVRRQRATSTASAPATSRRWATRILAGRDIDERDTHGLDRWWRSSPSRSRTRISRAPALGAHFTDSRRSPAGAAPSTK